MPFAINGAISKDALPGGIEITQEQYNEAVGAIVAGYEVSVLNGELSFTPKNVEPVEGSDEGPPEDLALLAAYCTRHVQAYLDGVAKSYGYDNISTAVTYAEESSVLKFQREGLAFREWRSLCWEHCYFLLELAKQGEPRPQTLEELINSLPLLNLP